MAYIRVSADNKINCSFLIGRAKVAPIKSVSIPKLELQAAVLGARLSQFIAEQQTIKFSEIHFWCDSMAVLGWIKSNDKQKSFIANRTGEIQQKTKVESWHHILGKLNPADHISRGIPPAELDDKWLTPPPFLSKPQSEWIETLRVETTKATITVTPLQPVIDVKRYSTWSKLLLVTTRVFQFINNLKTKRRQNLSRNNVDTARNYLFQISQENSFQQSTKCLKENKQLRSNDKILPLNPFLENNLLRVGGRTKRSELGYNTKHPIILSAKEFITRLFLVKCHEMCMHFGTEYTRNFIQQSHHILGIRNALRSVQFNCFECRRFRGQGLQPKMADLPDFRFPNTEHPVTFTNVGIDYIGPFTILQHKTERKGYICLFNCLVTRAIHLEVSEDLSTTTCLSAIRRFVARRGQPKLFISDNGSNFLGARKEIRKEQLKLDHEFLEKHFLSNSVDWRLNPPSGPHFGGPWERLVQIVKRALLLNLNSKKLTWDVFTTIVSEAESLTNSRPLTNVRSSNKDDDPLMPNHFLLGRPFANVPACLLKENLTLKHLAWTQVKQRLEKFWRMLVQEYVPTLNTRAKWQKTDQPLEEGDLVWILEEWTPRGIWPLGRVTRTFTGPDNIARSCEVKTALGKLKRPAVRLAHVFPKEPPTP